AADRVVDARADVGLCTDRSHTGRPAARSGVRPAPAARARGRHPAGVLRRHRGRAGRRDGGRCVRAAPAGAERQGLRGRRAGGRHDGQRGRGGRRWFAAADRVAPRGAREHSGPRHWRQLEGHGAMTREWTFGQRLGASIALLVVLTMLVGLVGYGALRAAVAGKDEGIDLGVQALVGAQEVATLRHRTGSDAREFVLTGREAAIDDMRLARTELLAILGRLRQALRSPESHRLLDAITTAEDDNRRALDAVVALRRDTGAPTEQVLELFASRVEPTAARLDDAVRAFVAFQNEQIQLRTDIADRRVALTSLALAGLTLLAMGVAVATGVVMTRRLSDQIGTAVGQIQSSSAELQAAATQQASGARQQATAMAEIATTISELLASSGQIAESARQVA